MGEKWQLNTSKYQVCYLITRRVLTEGELIKMKTDWERSELAVLTIQWQSNYPFVTWVDNRRQLFRG